MTDREAKLKYIILPFLAGSLILVGGYAFVRWAINIRLNAVHITQELWELWMPMILAALFTAFIMRSRFMLLSVTEKRRESLYWAAGIALAGSMIGSQFYITSVSRTMHQLETLSDMGRPRSNDCYRISSGYRFEPDKAGLFTEGRSIPKQYGPSELELIAYLAIPMSVSGQSPGPYTYWFVKEYETRIRSVTDAKIEREHRALYDKATAELNNGRYCEMDHLLAVPLTERTRSMLAAVETSPVAAISEPVLLTPRMSPMKKSDTGLRWALGAFAASLAVVIFVTFSSGKIANKKLKAFEARASLSWRERLDLRQLLSDYKSGQSSATWTLVSLNVLAFIVTVTCGVSLFSPSPLDMYEFGGATVLSVVNEGEWWRVFTSMFLHGGIVHLTMNMIVFILVGFVVEPVMKQWKYVLIYFTSGVGAFFLASQFLSSGTVLVGASGAIFGIMGALLSLYAKNPKQHREYLTLVLWTGGISILFGLLPGVSNSAHIGGLVTGFVLGLVFYAPPRKKRKRKIKKWQ